MYKLGRFILAAFFYSLLGMLTLIGLTESLKDTAQPYSPIAVLALFGVFLALARTLMFINRRKKATADLQDLLWHFFSVDCPLLKFVRIFCGCTMTIFLCLFTLVNVVCINASTGELLGYVCAVAKQPYLAEQLVNATKNAKDFSFVTVSRAGSVYKPRTGKLKIDRNLFENENVRLDAFVSSFYGQDSLEMALRYRKHASALFDHYLNDRLAMNYMKRSSELYRLHGEYEESIKSLSYAAEAQMRVGAAADLIATINVANKLDFQYTPGTLSSLQRIQTASVFADTESPLLRSKIAACEASIARHSKITADDVAYFIGSTLLWLLFRPLAFGTLGRLARMQWQRNLRNATSITASVQVLERLVTLELYSGNIARAESYSRQSLSMAESMKVA